MNQEIEKKINGINLEFEKRGYFIKEDIIELFETYENLKDELENIKFKKIEFFEVKEENCVGFTLDNMQVNFFLEYGEDEEGKWYEATAEIYNFG